MRKILVAFFLSLLTATSAYARELAPFDTVFICTGSSAHTYHTNRSCEGLVRCGGKIIPLPASIISQKRRLCKKCEASYYYEMIPVFHKHEKNKAKKIPKKNSKNTKSSKKHRYRSPHDVNPM